LIIAIYNSKAKDDILLKLINNDTYNLLKYILSTPKVDLLLNKKINIEYIDENNYKYLFHGSNFTNWYSILVNGLINCSGTNMMTNWSSIWTWDIFF
jgi:hypothetical protein